jgi:hypothetical protein
VIFILIVIVVVVTMTIRNPPVIRPVREPAATRQPTSPRPYPGRSTTPTAAPAPSKPGGVIDSVMGYGTGSTQMQVKKRSQSKLDTIQQQQNAKVAEGAK